MCCNGVMFHLVQLQPADSLRVLSAHGLKIKRKKGKTYIQQPCAAYCQGACSIYADRPQRCRIFECRQLQRLESAETTEEAAGQKVQEALALVSRLQSLMDRSGTTNLKKPLTKRYEKIVAEPANQENAALRGELEHTMSTLAALLEADFRIQ